MSNDWVGALGKRPNGNVNPVIEYMENGHGIRKCNVCYGKQMYLAATC